MTFMHWRRVSIITVLLGLALNLSITFSFAQSHEPKFDSNEKIARIGVLAFRGIDASRVHWQPLADYLTRTIENWKFELVPINLVSAPGQIEDKLVDFVITNPGHFVELADRFGLSALATRENRMPKPIPNC